METKKIIEEHAVWFTIVFILVLIFWFVTYLKFQSDNKVNELNIQNTKLKIEIETINKKILEEKQSPHWIICTKIKDMMDKWETIKSYRNEKTEINAKINKEKEQMKSIATEIDWILGDNLPGNLQIN